MKNARAAGRGTLTRGRTTQQVRLTELPEAGRPVILREFPRRNRPGVRIFASDGVVASADPAGFAVAARRRHVFRVGLLSR